MKVDIA